MSKLEFSLNSEWHLKKVHIWLLQLRGASQHLFIPSMEEQDGAITVNNVNKSSDGE